MFATLPVRPLWRTPSLLSATLLFGCSDPSGPDARPLPTTPNTLLAPAVVVTNTDDAGPGSLRQAILDAPDGAVIQFEPSIAGQTIALTTGNLSVDKSLTIEGAASAGMTISGSFNSSVFYLASGVVVLRNLSIVNGRTVVQGGGIGVGGSAILDHVLVANNESAASGGGIFTLPNAQLTLLNSTVTGNTANIGGGMTTQGLVTIRNSTITENTAPEGAGGIFGVNGTMSLRNSIIANNTAPQASTQHNCAFKSGVTVVVSGTNLSNDASCGTDAMITANPLLGPLAGNGGPTRTHALLFGSPAIDAGTACSEATDQRYVARNQGTSCDIGAVEFDTFRTITLTIGPNVAVNAKTGAATVTGTISCLGPAPTPLTISLSQTQKTVGKFTTIVQAQVNIPATCNVAPSSWSMALTPVTGKFEPGTATGAATVLTAPSGYVRTTVTAPLKVFQVK